MSQSKVINSVGVDFTSQVSDLRKRKKFLQQQVFFEFPEHSEEYRQASDELKRTNNALSLIDDLEVHPD